MQKKKNLVNGRQTNQIFCIHPIFKSRFLNLKRYMYIKRNGEMVITNLKLAVIFPFKNKSFVIKKIR